jgi:hypothetical protein
MARIAFTTMRNKATQKKVEDMNARRKVPYQRATSGHDG